LDTKTHGYAYFETEGGYFRTEIEVNI
jgi:hypothetical protein